MEVPGEELGDLVVDRRIFEVAVATIGDRNERGRGASGFEAIAERLTLSEGDEWFLGR